MKNKRIFFDTALMVIVLCVRIDKSQCSHLTENEKISKCCPLDSELKVNTTVDGIKTLYSCTNTTGIDEENQTIFGYNLYISDEVKEFENCEIIDFDVDGGLISTGGCIDMYDGILHGLECSDNKRVEVHKLYKCCAEGFSYDIVNRECIYNPDASDEFVNLIGNSVAVFETKVPTCQPNEVFVEYRTDIHPSTLIRSGIKLLSSAEFEFLKPGTFCIDGIFGLDSNATMIQRNHPIIIRSCRPRTICKDIPCVRRCCSNEMMMVRVDGKSVCANYSRNIKPTFHDIASPIPGLFRGYTIVEPSVYGLINMQECSKFKLSNNGTDDEAHFISHVDGSLYVNSYEQPFSNEDYCVEFVNMETVDIHAFICFKPYPQAKFKYYAIGLTVSSVFLAITLICYACLPKLLNLHGKTLVCYVISLLSGCISLAIVQFHTETKLEHCYFIAYFIFFCFLAAFCWQSIMCFDIWWTFGSVRSSRGMRKTKELRRFLLYSLYAWSVPSLLTALTIMVDYWHLVPEEWSPQIGKKNKCWFARDNWRGYFIFFIFPIGLHILTNAILFILTAIHCSKVKNEINRMQCSKDNEIQDKRRKFLADKAKYAMNLKLFIVMGVSWIAEILASVIPQDELWYVSDYFNILQGIIVFFIFVCKSKVWESIQQRLGKAPKNTKGPATVTTQLSVTSNGKLGKSCSTSTLSTSNTNLNVIRKVV